MSNTSIGLARKGSKYQMQRLALKNNQHFLNSIIGDSLIWISPKIEDEFREYQLNNKKISKQLDLKEGVFKDFWPTRQSQWDGIAIGESGTLYLFEAKSHLTEIQPGKNGKSEENNRLKYESIMQMAKELFGIQWNEETQMRWCKKYYQISNRIAFQQKLIQLSKDSKAFNNVVMVFLNFVNDQTWQNDNKMVDTSEKWDNHYDDILSDMGIDRKLLSKHNVRIINFDLLEIDK
jgi:hypothetical protein